MSEKQNRKVELIQTDSTNDNTTQSLYALQLGEYFLHFYLQETTSLSLDDESDVVVKVSAFGETQVSRIEKKIGYGSQTFWGQHFFFRKVFTERSELEKSEFKVQVLDHHSLLRDSIIGETGGSMLQIHSEPKNSILNKWTILTNAKKDYRKVMGFLKYSVNFCKASDPQTNLEQQSMLGKHQNKIEIPSNVQLKKKQILIKVFRGERLVKMDDNGKADPYVKFYLGSLEIKTRKVKESLNPVFNQKLYIPCVYPTITQNLKMSFKDYDRFGKNDFIGSLYFKIQDIEKGLYKDPQWNYFYGAPKNARVEDIEKKMNEFPEISSSFKGALLVSVEMQDVDEPEFMIEEFEEGEDQKNENLVTQSFTLRLDMEYVQNFGLDPDKSYQLCVEWGGKKEHLNLRKLQKKVFIVYQRVEMNQDFEVLINQEGNNRDLYQQLPDVVISICSDDKHYVFTRLKCTDYLLSRKDSNNSIILNFKTDNSVCKLDQHQAGQFSFKSAISQAQDFFVLTEQQWPPIKVRPKFEEIRIVCCYYQARKLVASDSSGSSDPSLQFYHLGSSINSTTYPKTLNPSWNEKLVLQSYAIENNIPPMVVNVWDKDTTFLGDTKKEFMGSSIIQLDQSMIAQKEEDLHFVQHQKWYEVEFGKNEKAGQVLLGFVIITKNLFNALDKMNIMRKITSIPLQKSLHHLKINMLGFRDLQSTGILPVRRVKCEINTSSVKDLLKMQEGAAYTDLVAMSKTSGSDPTIGSILTLSAHIPVSISHQPSLSCQVLDQGIAWLGHSSLIGTFEINIAAYTYISKMILLHKLQVLLKQQKELLNLNPDSIKFSGNIMILQPLIDKLKRETQKTEKMIKETDMWSYQRAQRKTDYQLQAVQQEQIQDVKPEISEEKSSYSYMRNIIEKVSGEKQQYQQEDQQEENIQQDQVNNDNKIDDENQEENHHNRRYTNQDKFSFTIAMTDQNEEQEEQQEEERGAYNYNRLIIEREDPEQTEEQEELKEGDVQESIINKEITGTIKRKQKQEKLQNQLVKEIENKIDLKNIMKNKMEKILKQKKQDIVIMPQYKAIKRLGETNMIEENTPNPHQYYKLGFRSKKRDTKHYRLLLDKELENTDYMGQGEFTTIDLFRGKRLIQKEQNFITRLLFGKEENCKKTGIFRGNVEVIEDEVIKEISKLKIADDDREILELPKNLEDWKYSKKDAEILKSVDVVIRVYIIDAQFEQSLDYNSENDSYVIIKLGDTEIIDKKIEQDQNRPMINKCFEFETTLPGTSTLSIKFMDQDRLKRDEEIGETKIDLEKRFFDKIWRSSEEKPIEKRKLYLPQYSTAQGWVRCWVDIQQKGTQNKIYDISPRPQTNLELRVVVWEVLDVPHLDFEEVSDLYVQVSLPSLDLSMNTDTHYRAQSGFGSFNWRTVFKLGVNEYTKEEMLRLNFKVYDKDFLSQDDYHSDVTVDIAQLVQDVLQNEQRRKYLGIDIDGKTQSKKVCLTMVPKEKNKDQKETKLIVSIDCLTEQESKQSPAGIGRSDPNQDPYCPEPIGRFQFTLNPLKLLNQMVGPGFRNKMCLIILMILLVAFAIFFLPGFISSIMANLFV